MGVVHSAGRDQGIMFVCVASMPTACQRRTRTLPRSRAHDCAPLASGDVSHFKDARHFASWFGLTPKEYSSGGTRYLGHISKRGDRYLRMLLTHGARSVLRAAAVARGKGRDVHGVRRWALEVQGRSNHNKAACALANKLARICYATLRDKEKFDETQSLSKKLGRQAFAMPA